MKREGCLYYFISFKTIQTIIIHAWKLVPFKSKVLGYIRYHQDSDDSVWVKKKLYANKRGKNITLDESFNKMTG